MARGTLSTFLVVLSLLLASTSAVSAFGWLSPRHISRLRESKSIKPLLSCSTAPSSTTQTTSRGSNSHHPTMPLTDRYFRRLKLDPSKLDAEPTLEKLNQIQEAHLRHITFDNLAQHGCGLSACLDVSKTAEKLLDRNRGGFCFEVNLLLAAWLETELGYEVKRVPVIVHAGPDIGFRGVPTHVILLVKIPNDDDDDETIHVCDVGFGEPPIHPLKLLMNEPQETPDGMISRFVREDDKIIMEWGKDPVWAPRMLMSATDMEMVSSEKESWPTSKDFAKGLDTVQMPENIFSQKLICCRLDRDRKMTLSGNKLKVTGPPRFVSNLEDAKDIPVTVTYFESVMEVRKVLEDSFGIPMAETTGLDLAKSMDADPSVWSSM